MSVSYPKIQNYKLGQTLGVGGFAKVKLGINELTNHKVAVKIFNRKRIRTLKVTDKIAREIRILKFFYHTHVIRLYEVMYTQDEIFVIMEYASGGELYDLISKKGRIKEPEARKYFQHLISGIEYCHNFLVCHRDLKPENLLLDEHMQLKICDFGLANIMCDGNYLRTSCGSPNYAAPDVICGKPYCGPEVDVWSCGVILYAMLAGSLPFDDDSIPNLFAKIRGAKFRMPELISEPAKDLIARMLNPDPETRISVSEIRSHKWFREDLPIYMQIPSTLTNTLILSTIDEDVFGELLKLPLDEHIDITTLRESIRNREKTPYLIAYQLIQDEKVKRRHLENIPTDTERGILKPMFNVRRTLQESEIGEFRSKIHSQYSAYRRNQLPPDNDPFGDGSFEGPAWQFGLRSAENPYEIVGKLCEAMVPLSFRWKIQARSYRIRFKMFPPPETDSDSEVIEQMNDTLTKSIKFDVQLYQIDHTEVAITFRHIRGFMADFLDIYRYLEAELSDYWL
mmetsp:Transcript_14438/g.15934  ORF Transcript_14438/g.15934 Transcript_14438/m.15934 type:complete len:510 (-) Transcript_14438:617-2146(-)